MAISGKRILVSGGAGFIGSGLLPHLLEENEVVVYDSFERDVVRRAPPDDHPRLEIVRGDVMDERSLGVAMDGCDVAIHLAAVTGIDTVLLSPTRTIEVNMLGTANLLACALDQGCERVICFSTSEVFGRQAFKPEETDRAVIGAPGEPRWTYAASKLVGEHLAHSYYREYGLPTVVIRPFNIYGPAQFGKGALRLFVERAIHGEDIEIHGDGTQVRAWCYIDDFVRATLASLESEAAVGESFNVGNSRSAITMHGLAKEVVRITESDSRLVFIETDRADIELRVPNTDKALAVLGFEAEVDLEEGIQRTAEWCRDRAAVRT